jgi:hypothetical protein
VGRAKEEPVQTAPRELAYQLIQPALPQPTYQPTKQPTYQPEQRPRQCSWAVRAFCGVAWAVVFFIVAGVVVSLLATQGAGDDPEVRKQLAQEAGRKQGPLLVLGCIVLTTVLGCLGWLPGTRRRSA